MELSVGNSFPNLDNILLEFGETLTKSNTSTLSATLLDNVLSGSFLDQILNRTSISRKRFPRSRYSMKNDDGAPMIIVPETTDRDCIKSNSVSSIGFLAFVVSVINAVMQTANNINNNNNNRNNNDNDNNQNNNNVNIANLGSLQMNTNMAMGGRRKKRRKRESRDDECPQRSQEFLDAQLCLDASTLAISYIELWIKTFHEEKISCVASLLCKHASDVNTLIESNPNQSNLEMINQTLSKGFGFYVMNTKDLDHDFLDLIFKDGSNCDTFSTDC